MKIHLRPAHTLAITLFAAILPISGTLLADNHAPAPQTFVLESFACTYNGSNDAGDLNAARDAYVKAADKAGITKPRSLVWNRFKGGPDIDFLWFNIHPDLAAFASHTNDMMRSDMAGAVDKFDAMADCSTSNVSNALVLFAGGEPPVTNPPGVVESYGCFFAPGRGPADLPDLGGHIAGVSGSLENNESLVLIGTEPMTPGPGTPDRFLFGVHEDMDTWAARTTALRASPDGQQMLRHFGSVFGNCYAALWSTQQMVEGDQE